MMATSALEAVVTLAHNADRIVLLEVVHPFFNQRESSLLHFVVCVLFVAIATLVGRWNTSLRASHPVCNEPIQALRESSRCNLAVDLDTAVLCQRLRQRERVQLDVGEAVCEPLEDSGDDVACPEHGGSASARRSVALSLPCLPLVVDLVAHVHDELPVLAGEVLVGGLG